VEIADLGEIRALLGHAAAYAGLTFCALLAQRAPRPALTFAAVLVYGALLEVAQGTFGLRSMQAGDILANAVGSAAGLGLALLVLRRA